MTTDLLASAARFGGYAAAEARLFEVLGSWALQPSGPGQQRHFAEAGAIHAERAAAWRERVPVVPGVDVDGLCQEPPPELHAHLGALAGVAPDERRAAAGELVAALTDLYRRHRAEIDARLDGPTARLLDSMIPG